MSNSIEIKDNIVPVSLIILSSVALTFGLYAMKSVLVPFAFSIFLYFVAMLIMEFLCRRLHLPKYISLFITFIFVVLIVTGLVLLIAISIKQFINNFSLYGERLMIVLDTVADHFEYYGVTMNLETIREPLSNIPVIQFVQTVTGGVLTFVTYTLLTVIFTMFLVVGTKVENDSYIFNEEIKQKISRYIIVKFGVSALVATLVGIIFLSLGMELGLVFAVLTFFFNFIPNVGSVIITLLPLPIALMQFGISTPFLLALILPAICHFMIGNVLEPKLMGKSLELHPVVILLSLLFWGFLWGVSGMFLAVPLTAVSKILLTRSPHTKRIAKMLEGKF